MKLLNLKNIFLFITAFCLFSLFILNLIVPEVSEKNIPTQSQEALSKNIFKNTFGIKALYPVPFTSQAPFKIWDEVHEESCEEASLIMVKYYADGKILTPKIAEQEIQNLKDYQIKKYGDYKDTDMAKTAEIGRDYYKLSLKVVYDFEFEDMLKQLSEGNILIVPTAGRLLNNPYFANPGPLYHNLVVIGYDKILKEFIVNDPGTSHGKNFRYSFETLYNAIHDFTGDKKDIEKGGKAMIVYTMSF